MLIVRNTQKPLKDAAEALSKLDKLYLEGNTSQKRQLISSIFPKKIVFEKSEYRTVNLNKAVKLIFLINKELKRKK